ncbi:MAG: hypothetical protein M3Q81_05235, partial [bacterium]|nr:hypothetical protein [bacterium]
MAKFAPKTKKNNPILIILAFILMISVVGGVIVTTIMSQRAQDISSDASSKYGFVKVTLDGIFSDVLINQPVTVPVVINTDGAQIDGVQLGMRFKGVSVKDVKFVPKTSSLTLSQNVIRTNTPETAIDVVFLSPSNQPVSVTGSQAVLGDLYFTPNMTGTLEIAFDPTFSKVTTHKFGQVVAQPIATPKPSSNPST